MFVSSLASQDAMIGAWEMAHWLRARAALTEDSSLVSSTHVVGQLIICL